MRCNKEEFVEGVLFHIYNHSVDEIDLFYDQDDYHYFLKKLKKNYFPDELSIFAYCLMPNHFHFCIKQNSSRPIYDVFNRFILSYALHFNSKYKRRGKLFANKLQHKKINSEEYLVDICPYIHRNPIRAGLVGKAEDWEFSNYHEWIGIRNGILFDDELLLHYFRKAETYKKYIENFDDKEIANYLFSNESKT
ncbi:MAG: transposase [Fidelibacterota bacterium]